MNIFLVFLCTYGFGALLTYFYPYWFIKDFDLQLEEGTTRGQKCGVAVIWGGLFFYDLYMSRKEKKAAK